MPLFGSLMNDLVLVLALSTSHGADAPPVLKDQPPPPKIKVPLLQKDKPPFPSLILDVPQLLPKVKLPVARLTCALRNRSAPDLAKVLSQHFASVPDFLAVPDAGSNTLLLSGPKTVLEEALKTVKELDRPARTVHVEVFLIDLASKKDIDFKGLERSDLSGDFEEVMAKVRALQKSGVVGCVKQIQLTAIEGKSAEVKEGASKPQVTGITTARMGGGGGPPGDGFPGGRSTGGVSRSIMYREVGTLVHVKPEVSGDGLVTIELRIQDSRMRTPEDGVILGEEGKGTPLRAAEMGICNVESRVQIRSGKVVLVEGAKTNSKAGSAQELILITASLE